MRIKRLELIGFKSFADRTEIHFGDGVTCIVGPNGCGKSNISDAIRWVFGERSAKLLRGTHMEDVIFSGTELRKPMGFAEVSLVLDNVDHRLPIEYEEVVITRRLDRSGQSEYLLNRTPCRLRDILDLILDTGMGSNSYSMIEQGRVDAVVQADPQDRRFLIEEAAGISKYKVKKVEALRKLERTEQNLLRIRDIVAEVQKNIQYSERQARRAERYKTQFDELKKLEITKAFLDLKRLKEEQTSEELKKQELQDRIQKLETESQDVSQKQSSQSQILNDIVEKESKQSAFYYELQAEKRSTAQKIDFNRERLENCEHREVEIRKERELLEANLFELEKEHREKILRRNEELSRHNSTDELLEREEGSFEKIENQFQQLREEEDGVKKSLFEIAAEQTQIRNETNRIKTFFEAKQQEQNRRKETLKRLLIEKENFETKRLKYQENLTQTSSDSVEKDNVLRSISILEKEIESIDQIIREKTARLQELNSRMKLLEELSESSEEMQQKLLSGFGTGQLEGSLVKTLRDVLEIQEGYEAAVETVLGSFAQGLIAENVETAKGLIREMAKSHMGPCGIFVQSLARENGTSIQKNKRVEHPRIQNSIQDVVRVQRGFEALFSPLFDNVYVVDEFSHDHLDELLKAARGIRLVTKQGILLGPDACIFFRNGRISSENGSFHREAEIQDLKKTCDILKREIELSSRTITDKKNEISKQEARKASLDEAEREIIVGKKATESFLRGIDDRLAGITEEIRILEFEIEEWDREALQANSRLKEFEQKLSQIAEREVEKLKQQRDLEKLSDTIRLAREQQLQSLTRLKTIVEGHEERLRTLDAAEALLKNQIETTKSRIQHIDQEKVDLTKRIKQIEGEETSLSQNFEELGNRLLEVEKVLGEIRGRKAFQEEGLKEFLSQTSRIDQNLKAIRDELHVVELKSVDMSYRGKSISDRMNQAYAVKLNELKSEEYFDPKLDLAILEENINALKAKVESFGPVNLLAVDEYEELKQRFEFLSGQEKDLTQARDSLLEAIRKINRTTKTLFSETFDKAQKAFQEYYGILFGGGHAELQLIEPDPHEEQEAGVDILARPPGKKIQHISLLSGGEKTLTAMALLFALFRIKPSPICVLDEVDAALDEANVDRFLNVLKSFLSSTQFLVVTHNRKTIATGDCLYGVTMEESGVSKMVSVKVAQTQREIQNRQLQQDSSVTVS